MARSSRQGRGSRMSAQASARGSLSTRRRDTQGKRLLLRRLAGHRVHLRRRRERLVIPRPHVDWFALSPELALLGVASLALMAAVLIPARARKPVAAAITALGYAGAGVAAGFLYDRSANGGSTIADAI